MSDQIETLGQGTYLALRKQGRWEYVERIQCKGAAMIGAVTPEGDLLLVEQYRASVGTPVIELPAGLVGDAVEPDESFADAARRELLEETGYHAESLEHILTGSTSAGLTGELVHLFIAHGVTRVDSGGGDVNEDITVHRIPLEEVMPWLLQQHAAGKCIDFKIYAALVVLQPSGR
jgi:ADP-ribose pyrophosphatase